jgi:hypothetical protein
MAWAGFWIGLGIALAGMDIKSAIKYWADR